MRRMAIALITEATRRDVSMSIDFAVKLLGPGSRLRSPGTRAREGAARKANRWPWPHSRCQTAQCCSFPRRVAAPGLVSYPFAPDPNGGVGGAPTGALFLCRVCETRLVRTQRGAARPMTRDARLSALHRGDFRPGAALPSPALPPDPCSDAPRSQVVVPGGRCPGPPEPAVTSRGRRTPLPAPPFRTVSGRRPSMSEDANHIL